MKRTFTLIAVIILLLLLGGAAWYFLVYSKSQGPATAAEMVPPSASVFLWLPHVPPTLEKFKATPVYKMWQEQGVQTALEKLNPFKQKDIPLPEDAKKIWDLTGPLWDNFQGEAFIAVTGAKSEPEVQVDVIGGFQTGPDPAAFLAWADKVKTSFPNLKWDEKTYPAQNYFATETTIDSKKITLCVAQWKNWVLVGVGESAFQQLLDHIHAGKPDPVACLSGQASYAKFLSQQPQGFDTLIYVNPLPLLATARQALEKRAPEQLSVLKTYQGMEALMFTSTIEGSDFRDRALLQSPKDKRPDYGNATVPLKGTTARFTTPQTLAYFVQNVDPSKTLAQLRNGGPEEKKMIDQGIATINQTLSGMQLDLEKDVAPKLGPELAFILNWEPGKPFPDLTMAMEHQDQAMVQKLVDFVTGISATLSGGKLQIQKKDVAGGSNYLFVISMSPVAPSIWLGKDVLLITSNGAGIETMVTRTGNGLLDSEPYKALAAKSIVKKPQALNYLDTENLVVYTHGAISSLIPMLAGITGNPDLAKTLPPVDNLRPYLGHWLMLGEVNDEGFVMEGLYEKGHPLIYGAVGIALIADLGKALAPLAAMAGKSATAPASGAPAPGNPEIDASLVLQDLVDLDDATTSWIKEKQKTVGTQISWNDIVSYLPENSQVATRIGLDPLGNAYVLGKVGPGQVIISVETQKHFEGKVPAGFWGKFSNKPQGELPTP